MELKLKEIHDKKIRDILDERAKINLPVIEKDASIQSLLSILAARDHVWVIEEKGSRKVMGVVTEKICCACWRLLACPNMFSGKIRRFNRIWDCHQGGGCDVQTADNMLPDDKVGDALQKMVNAGLRRLPVIDGDEIVGKSQPIT